MAIFIDVLFRFGEITNMFTKLTRSGGHTYVQLVESFRDESSRTRQRTICILGLLDEVGGQVDSLLEGPPWQGDEIPIHTLFW